ncbi:MAG: ferrous iron transport protein B, partial [Clostridia bacterium]|nr:ferrous iron transport protein B [Clostridia bacterium]
MELDIPVLVTLNMCDLLEKKGLTVDENSLSKQLSIPCVKISALKKTGIKELISLLNEGNFKKSDKKIYENDIEETLNEISKTLKGNNKRFTAVKIVERDEDFVLKNKFEKEIVKIEKNYQLDTEQIIANQRYNFVVKVKQKVVTEKEKAPSITDKLDKVFLNKWLAIPIFVAIMAWVYYLSVGVVGTYTVDLVDGGVTWFSETVANWLTNLNASEWAVSLLCDGMIAGVGAVLTFVPQLIILFICIALLETTGYMSRISFFFDRLFRKFGLSGKSLIPFIVGSGCSVPAIMTTRTIEDENERNSTIMLTPFIPCSAKLPIIALFANYFFVNSWLVTTSLYLLSICIIIISAIFLRKFVFKGKSTSFISELPEYKLPSLKHITKDVWEKTISFIKRAGTVILLCSIAIWVLVSFDWTFTYGVNVENSILASIGNLFSWIFYPIVGTNSWAVAVSAVQGLVAKEQVISSMAVIAGLAEEVTEGALIFSSTGIFGFFNPASAYAFMIFNLFSAPCFGAIGAMHREFNNTKKTLLAVLFQTGIAWLLACLVNGIGSLIMLL